MLPTLHLMEHLQLVIEAADKRFSHEGEEEKT
jgi:hypothetical protein